MGLRIQRPDDGSEWLLDPSLVGELEPTSFAVEGERFHVVLQSESTQRLLHVDASEGWVEELDAIGEHQIWQIGVAADRVHLLARELSDFYVEEASVVWTQEAGSWTARAPDSFIVGFAHDAQGRLWWASEGLAAESVPPTIRSEDGCQIDLGADATALAIAGGEGRTPASI